MDARVLEGQLRLRVSHGATTPLLRNSTHGYFTSTTKQPPPYTYSQAGMHPFGGTPKCPTCDKNVYAAEQVMGPGRRIYHKPCLKCMTCSRRLDSLSLLEHNHEPYCKTCHVKNFGTRDLRSANLTPSSPSLSPTRPLRSPPPISNSDSFPSSSSIPEEPSEEDVSGSDDAEDKQDTAPRTASPTSLRPSTTFPRTASPPPTNPKRNSQGSNPILRPNGYTARPLSPTKTGFGWGGPTYSARSLSPTATGSSTASAPVYLRQNVTGSSTGSVTRFTPSGPLKPSYTGNLGDTSPRKHTFGPSPGFGGTPSCPRCGKAVYFAEQVKASGRTWHKPCLRCTECSALLDSTRLTEKDGQVMCRSCYSKLHGPQGSGYALLGRAG